MSARWTLDAIAAATGGRVVGDPALEITGVSTDSRAIHPGEVFVAIRGDHHDGHDYVAAALEMGAGAVVVRHGGATVVPRVEVDDPLDALAALAAARRASISVPVVGVTGSTGKTTTKDLLRAALPEAWASPRSYNNEVGVPLTVLATPGSARHVVVEVGSRGVGHIRSLIPAVRPDVAVITNLGVVHLETFGTVERLAAAKWELVEGLQRGGVAVLPADEPRLNRSHPGRTVTFGVEVAADVAVRDVVLDDSGRPRFTVEAHGETRRGFVPLAGRHQAKNAAAAIAAGIVAGVGLDRLVEGMATASGSPWRMEIHGGAYTVVNDAYNANPDSVEAALRTVAELPGRHIAVLGEMAELGPVSVAEHERIGGLASSLGYAAVVTIGAEPGIARGAGPIARAVPDPPAAAKLLAEVLRNGDVVLVKASRAVGLEDLARHLIEEANA